jgi:DNA polymerase III delta prime subunit
MVIEKFIKKSRCFANYKNKLLVMFFCKFLDNRDRSTVQIWCDISSYTHITIQWFGWWFGSPIIKEIKKKNYLNLSTFD